MLFCVADPVIKACVRRQLLAATGDDTSETMSQTRHRNNSHGSAPGPPVARSESSPTPRHRNSSNESALGTNGSCSELESLLPCDNHHQDDDQFQWQPLAPNDKSISKPKFEAYMMTGEHILNLSRTPQAASLMPKHQKKDGGLRHQHPHHKHHHHHHNSVPTSPNETDIGYRLHQTNNKSGANSAGTSPVSANKRDSNTPCAVELAKTATSFTGYVRTSRSEDHLQFQKDSSMSAVDIEIEEDVTSSLNTLLDTRLDSGSTNNVSQTSDRIVWTYNAPVSSPSSDANSGHVVSNGNSMHSTTSPSSSLRSTSPQSPTSVSSSVMSSRSGSHSHRVPLVSDFNAYHQTNGDLSVSEAISNISSPDYHDEETMDILNSRDLMEISDHSDSDSTILVSEPQQKRVKNGVSAECEHKIVIQVKGPEKDTAYSPKCVRRTHDDKPHDSGNTTPELQGYKVSNFVLTRSTLRMRTHSTQFAIADSAFRITSICQHACAQSKFKLFKSQSSFAQVSVLLFISRIHRSAS